MCHYIPYDEYCVLPGCYGEECSNSRERDDLLVDNHRTALSYDLSRPRNLPAYAESKEGRGSQKRTLELSRGMSALCHKRTFCAADTGAIRSPRRRGQERRWEVGVSVELRQEGLR